MSFVLFCFEIQLGYYAAFSDSLAKVLHFTDVPVYIIIAIIDVIAYYQHLGLRPTLVMKL